MSFRQRLLLVFIAVLYLFPGAFAGAQAYTSIVVFGDSLSDTGNDAALSKAKYTVNAQVPGPASGYTDGRFTDGLDTSPAARNYTGVWIEQVAAALAAKPAVVNSLAGGSNYAYGFATTNTGTSVFAYGPGNALVFNVNNMGQQVSDYLATKPTITNKTLFVVWGGANDLINATSQADIVNAATREAGIVQTLIAAGATDFIIPNLPPLGLVPRFNGSPTTSIPPTQASAGFNQALAFALSTLPAANPSKTLHLYPLDVYTLFTTIVGPPIAGGFANVTASSQLNTAVNPDTYLFWDDLHPTTAGHHQLALAALTLLGTPVTTMTALQSSTSNANLKANVTFTATVTATSGTPIGQVTFSDGTTVLGTGMLSGSTTAATATFTTSALTAGTHTITATYTGVNGYVSSTSTAVSQIVTAPALTAAFVPASLTIPVQGLGFTSLVLSPVGGYSGTATVACGTLPAHFACAIATPTLTLKGDNAQVSTQIIISTVTANGLRAGGVYAALPCLGLLGLLALRRKKLLRSGVVLMVLLSAGALVGMVGCSGGSPNAAPSGSYTVPVTVTANGTAISTTLTVVIQ